MPKLTKCAWCGWKLQPKGRMYRPVKGRYHLKCLEEKLLVEKNPRMTK